MPILHSKPFRYRSKPDKAETLVERSCAGIRRNHRIKLQYQKTVSRARLREELGDVGSLMRAVSVSPQTVGGYQGLRILDMQSGSYIEELGLRKDDLLLGANGKPLRGFGDLGGLGDLADKSAITLEVLRNGKKTIIRYDVQS